MMPSRLPHLKRLSVYRLALVGLFSLAVIRVAWLSDDSLITLRTILNISHGWGFGFNSTESVQAFTHPLWMMLWLVLGSVTGSWTISILLTSTLLTSLALLLVLRLTSSALLMVCGTLFALGSNALIDYSTSGLENPLSIALTVILFVLMVRPSGAARSEYLVGLVVALILLNRLDLVVLVGVPLLHWFWATRGSRRWRITRFLITFCPPLLMWFSFSYLAYGSLLPNTFQAKRNLLISQSALIEQGLFYVWLSVREDPLTGLLLLGGLTLPLLTRKLNLIPWSLGVLLYLVYIAQNGGDFMIFRFLSVPTVVTLAITIETLDVADLAGWLRRRRTFGVIAASIYLVFSLSLPTTTFAIETAKARVDVFSAQSRGINDERAFYAAKGFSFLLWWVNQDSFSKVFSIATIEARADSWPHPTLRGNQPVEVSVYCGGLGAFGIEAGPSRHLIDSCALTDRFLAETKFDPAGKTWRIGHFERQLPAGYEDAVRYSDPSRLVDPSEEARLRELWDVIRD